MLKALLLLAALCVALDPARAQDELPLQAVRLGAGEHIRLTGRLDHPAWQRAPVFDRFVSKYPRVGDAPPQATRVQVLFDEQALYVGITALEPSPSVCAGRWCGTTRSSARRTSWSCTSTPSAAAARRSSSVSTPPAAWATACTPRPTTARTSRPTSTGTPPWRITPKGWTAVLRLPFASLRFAEGPQQPWRMMVGRRLPRDDFHLLTSVVVPARGAQLHRPPAAAAGRAAAGAACLPDAAAQPHLQPAHDRPADGPRRNRHDADASLDLKWRPRAELVVDATLNPDFSQVALDVPQLQGNTRFALSIAEKRPFFFESADLLRTPTDAFYTRSFTAPRAGLRATWRGTRVAGSALVVDDRGGGLVLLPGAFGTDVADQPASRTLAARVRSDEGGLQWGGVLAARRYEEGRGDNTVLGPDVETWPIDGGWRLRAQWLHASSSALPDAQGRLVRAPAQDGDRLLAMLARKSEEAETTLTLDDVSDGFRHDSGFVSQAGVRKLQLFQSLGWHGLGPTHEFWVNVHANHTQRRGDGQTLEQQLYPGLYLTMARNLEWWLEWHAVSRLRSSASGPLLAQRYVETGLSVSPATWFPLLDLEVQAGRLADTSAQQLRPGVRWNVSAKLRPLPALELEPGWSASWLRGDGQRAYDERVGNLLAVWHLGPRSHLRAIVQHQALDRGGVALDRSRQVSLTWAWRPAAGTVLHVGASRARAARTSRRAAARPSSSCSSTSTMPVPGGALALDACQPAAPHIA
jgi:hypothetical protein